MLTNSMPPGDEMCGLCDSGEAQAEKKGMAPDAQLMVYDFGDAAGDLDVPSQYGSMLFKPAYDAGARVSSHSWGATLGEYYQSVHGMDSFLNAKQARLESSCCTKLFGFLRATSQCCHCAV
jgi:hypothetical protein